MRLLVARCEVLYNGRLTARLPEAGRLLMFKADGSLLVHDDAGGFRPLNWIQTDSARTRPSRAPSGLRLAFPVVDRLAVPAREDVLVLCVLGEDLVAVGVLDYLRTESCREHKN